MTVKKCEFKDGVCVHCGDDHIDTDCIGWIDTPPNPEIARLETELLAATIRIDNDAVRIAEMTEQLDIQAGSIDAVQAANVRLAAELASAKAWSSTLADACDDLRAELDALRNQEPVAWFNSKRDMTYMSNFHKDDVPLYLAPGAQGEKP